jgi:GDP/UDP-N,N'-diacetylbacillosamine 2-epimerase (hydrolysing)
MRKVCVVSGTRADFGVLYWLMKEIQDDSELELQVVVTGMHLSTEFGLTWKEIEKAGFPIHKKIEMLLSSDSSSGITKSIGLGMIGFADVWKDLRPDIVIVLGDRFEIFAAVSSTLISRIPVAHLHGGETTEGAFDESIRHSLTKMSHLHFTATDEYRKRVIQLGESPDRVFNVGGLGIDNIKRLKLLTRKEFESSIDFNLNKNNHLITFHPVTLENTTAENQIDALLSALDELENTNLIFTMPNADTDGRVIIKKINDYIEANPHKAKAFTSLGQLRYLSALQFVDGVIGNSSSGLAEVPSFRIGTINIGDRQRGRMKATSIIDCNPEKKSILDALQILSSKEFQKKLKYVKNPYGEGGAAEKIKGIIKSVDLNNILKKKFFDLTTKF